MKHLLLLIIPLLFIHYNTTAQGCVAIRSTGGFCTAEKPGNTNTASKWQLNINNRYFRSFRHFVGEDEQKQRAEQGTEVINHSYTMDIAITRTLNTRWSIALDLPVESYARSSLYEHKNIGRFSTHSFGVGDIRFAVYSWILDPAKSPKGNIQAGLGLKLPTGDYKYLDHFHTSDSTTILGPVDQSIQLGDGGTGITTEINAFYNFSPFISVYGNFYYLISPREQNGVSTTRGAAPTTATLKNGSDVMSVPDQFMFRAGANINIYNLVLSAGLRDECLPVHDLVGGSNGFRRPGYIISADPGLTYNFKKVSVYGFLPFALVRNRTQSVPDKISTGLQGKNVHGDAAFADYVVNIGCSFRF